MTCERTWTADIIRVLWAASPYMLTREELARRLWVLRKNAGFKPPKAFIETVQSTLNHHTSQSKVWAKNGSRPEDDLFYSPRGKGSGTWAVHRDRAADWLEDKGFPRDTGSTSVTVLAMDVARELVRQAIKTKDLDIKEWPATRITEAAKVLLDSQGENGKIITTARQAVEVRSRMP